MAPSAGEQETHMESEVKSNGVPVPSNDLTSRALGRLGGRGREP
jgi:hypothetical protein